MADFGEKKNPKQNKTKKHLYICLKLSSKITKFQSNHILPCIYKCSLVKVGTEELIS